MARHARRVRTATTRAVAASTAIRIHQPGAGGHHGTGGGVYDQVTERWWSDWTKEDLAPKAVVSADVYLPFDVPVATRDELHRAVWFEHHLPFNVDRYVEAGEAEAALVADAVDRRRREFEAGRALAHALLGELDGVGDDGPLLPGARGAPDWPRREGSGRRAERSRTAPGDRASAAGVGASSWVADAPHRPPTKIG